MEEFLAYMIPALAIGLFLLVIWKVGSWAISDALLRGKPPVLVFMAVIFFFPWGLIAWLIFRPEPPQRPFDLRRFRQQ